MSNYEKKKRKTTVDSQAVEEDRDKRGKKSAQVWPDDDSDAVYFDDADFEDGRDDGEIDEDSGYEDDYDDPEYGDDEAEEVCEDDDDMEVYDDDDEEYDDSDDDENDDEYEDDDEDEHPVKRGGKAKKIAAVTAGSILGIALLVYLGFAFFFQSHYYFYTEINGTDFSGKTVEDVENYMKKQVDGYTLTFKKPDGGEEKILGSEIALEYQPGKELKQYMENQNAFLWPQAFWKSDKVQASIGVKYDAAALDSKITALAMMQPENQTAPVSAKPVFQETEYVIQPETAGTQINEEVLRKKAASCITEFNPTLDMTKEDCFAKPRFTADSQEVIAARDTMNRYVNAAVTYDLNPNTEVVDKNTIAQWLGVDENMGVTVNRELVAAYVAELASRYNTVGTTRTIQTPSGKSANVSGGSYGWKLDQEAETDTLIGNITAGEPVTREPVFSQRAVLHAANDWGNTFVEVDLSAQHMWYISNGKSVFQADVVTGKPDRSHETPAGIFSILEKMRNKVLRGNVMPNGEREYETPVSYWMRVTWSGVGFHDATWQSSFGGTRYKNGYGSHGCINMSYSGAASLYDMVYVGVPVIIHY